MLDQGFNGCPLGPSVALSAKHMRRGCPCHLQLSFILANNVEACPPELPKGLSTEDIWMSDHNSWIQPDLRIAVLYEIQAESKDRDNDRRRRLHSTDHNSDLSPNHVAVVSNPDAGIMPGFVDSHLSTVRTDEFNSVSDVLGRLGPRNGLGSCCSRLFANLYSNTEDNADGP